jgi:hypothetical protein
VSRFRVDAARCIRCASSASIAGPMIMLGPRSAAFSHQPRSPEEHDLARQAQALCPVDAIREESEP